MDTKPKLAANSLLKKIADKQEELKNAVTVGEYWAIQCEINTIYQQLNTNNNDKR